MCRARSLTTQTASLNVGNRSLSHPFWYYIPFLSVTLTPSRPLPQPSRPHASLVSLHLAYIWKSVSGCSDVDSSNHLVEGAGPFSSALFLPAEALLNRVTDQFLTYHLVGYVLT